MTHFAQLGAWRARTTRAARPAACHPWGLWRRTPRGGFPSGAVPRRGAGRGRAGAQGEEKLKKLAFPPRPGRHPAAALFFSFPRVAMAKPRSPGAEAMPGAVGWQAPSGPGRRGPPHAGRGGEGGGRPCSCRQSPTGCTVPRGRGAAPRAGSGRGWSGSACMRVCARRGAASARPSLGPARLPRPGGPFACPRSPPLPFHLRLLHFASSSQCLEPESPPARRGRILSGWNETPQPGGAAPGRGTRAGDGSGAGLGLSAGSGRLSALRGSPLPPWRRGGDC